MVKSLVRKTACDARDSGFLGIINTSTVRDGGVAS